MPSRRKTECLVNEYLTHNLTHAIQGLNMRTKIFLLYISISFTSLIASIAQASECDKYTQQIRKLEDQRRMGGKATKMNRSAKRLSELEDERFHCLQDPDRNPMIQTTSGASQTPQKKVTSPTKKSAPEKSAQIALGNIEKPKRKLSECIKPNQRIDKEVNDCLQGLIEPSWK
jgi:hypothetical protein